MGISRVFWFFHFEQVQSLGFVLVQTELKYLLPSRSYGHFREVTAVFFLLCLCIGFPKNARIVESMLRNEIDALQSFLSAHGILFYHIYATKCFCGTDLPFVLGNLINFCHKKHFPSSKSAESSLSPYGVRLQKWLFFLCMGLFPYLKPIRLSKICLEMCLIKNCLSEKCVLRRFCNYKSF